MAFIRGRAEKSDPFLNRGNQWKCVIFPDVKTLQTLDILREISVVNTGQSFAQQIARQKRGC